MGRRRGVAIIVGVVAALGVFAAAATMFSRGGDDDDAPRRHRIAASSSAAVRHITIPVGDMTFDALTAGPASGEAVILLHGFPQTSESWRPQVEALGKAGYRAIAPDQRGYSPGARPPKVEDYAIVKLVEDVTGMADALHVKRFHLVGHDWGGAVAWTFAALHPDRLLSLEVLATPNVKAFAKAYSTPGSDQASRSGYMDFFRAKGTEDKLLADHAGLLHTMMAAAGIPAEKMDTYLKVLGTPEAMGAALNWYRAMDVGPADALPDITVPTLYVYATKDIAFSRQTADATRQYVKGPYQYVILDGVSHFISEQIPDKVNALLLAHIRRYTAAK